MPCVLDAYMQCFSQRYGSILREKIVPGNFLFLMFWPFLHISMDCHWYHMIPWNEYIILLCSDIDFDREFARLLMFYDFSKNITISVTICRRKKLRPSTESSEQAEQLCSSLLSLYEAGKPPKIDVEKVKKWTRMRAYMDCLSQLHGWVLWKKNLKFLLMCVLEAYMQCFSQRHGSILGEKKNLKFRFAVSIGTYMDCLSQIHGWVLWKKNWKK